MDYAERQKHYAKIEKDRKTKVLTFVWAKTKRERGPEPAPFLVTAPAAGDGSPAAARLLHAKSSKHRLCGFARLVTVVRYLFTSVVVLSLRVQK